MKGSVVGLVGRMLAAMTLPTLSLLACRESTVQAPPAAMRASLPRPCPSDEPMPDPLASHCGSAIPCQSDRDCPRTAPCGGPCAAGSVITAREADLDCTVALCPEKTTACSRENVCVVR